MTQNIEIKTHHSIGVLVVHHLRVSPSAPIPVDGQEDLPSMRLLDLDSELVLTRGGGLIQPAPEIALKVD